MNNFVDTTPQEANESVVETTVESTDNTSQSTETVTEQPKIKVKYDKQEMEIPYDEAVQHIQKGMNYDRAVERAKAEAHQQARDSYIAEQGYEWMGKPITTEAEYKQALKEQEVYENLQKQSLPDEVINEILEGRRDREERQTEKQRKAQEEKQNQEYQEFFKAFPDVKPDSIKREVWEKVNAGIPLKYAYMEQELNELKSKQKIQETNAKNADTSTGSVTGNGAVNNDYISYDTFNSNRKDQSWVNKNFKKIMESRAKW